jgi:hypothetical protein
VAEDGDRLQPSVSAWQFVSRRSQIEEISDMRFLSIYKTVERNAPPTAEEMARMEKLIEESTKAGVLLATEGCLPSAAGARVRLANGQVMVTDGPFTETKEVVGGFAILRASSKEEAIRLAKEFLAVAGEGECEIRQLYDAPDSAQPQPGEAHKQLIEQFSQVK